MSAGRGLARRAAGRSAPARVWARAPRWRDVALLGVLLAWGVAGVARADEGDEPKRRVSFSVESAREVPNDWITAVVAFSAENADPAKLAAQVNGEMAWALDQVRAEPKVAAKTGGYRTDPVYEEGRLRRWRGSQTLVLESGDDQALTELVGRLQARVQLQSFDFSVKPETRERVEQELVAAVLVAFTARAELVRKSLGADGYALDDVSIGTGGGPPPMYRAPMMEMASKAGAVPPPAVEGGTSRISVSANGSIVLE